MQENADSIAAAKPAAAPFKGRFSRGNVLNGILFRSFSEDADSIAAANADDRKRTGDIRCKQLILNVLGQSPFESFE